LEAEFSGFLQEEYVHLVPLLREVGQRVMVRAMLASLWAEQQGIAPEKILDLFPFLQRGTETDGKRYLRDLSQLALTLQSRKPKLFETFVRTAEEDSSFSQSLWSHLASRSPGEIFAKESLFPAILREAFERLLGLEQEGRVTLAEQAGPEDRSSTQPFLQLRKEMGSALENYQLFKKKQAALTSPKIKQGEPFSKWESTFIRTMSPIPALLETVQAQLARIGIPEPPFLKKEEKQTRQTLARMNKDFSDFYQQALTVWEKDDRVRPTMIQDIPFLLSRKRNVPDHEHHLYLLMDGMRWDLWERIKLNFFGQNRDSFRLVREGATWAHRPTTTAAQLPYLEKSLQEAYPDRRPDELIWKINAIDEKIHTEKHGLEHLFAGAVNHLELELLFRLRDLPSRTLLIIFADHGFVENPAFSPADKYRADRYVHGQDSPFEVIVPWAWVMRL
jgi:hypothetical protein